MLPLYFTCVVWDKICVILVAAGSLLAVTRKNILRTIQAMEKAKLRPKSLSWDGEDCSTFRLLVVKENICFY